MMFNLVHCLCLSSCSSHVCFQTNDNLDPLETHETTDIIGTLLKAYNGSDNALLAISKAFEASQKVSFSYPSLCWPA